MFPISLWLISNHHQYFSPLETYVALPSASIIVLYYTLGVCTIHCHTNFFPKPEFKYLMVLVARPTVDMNILSARIEDCSSRTGCAGASRRAARCIHSDSLQESSQDCSRRTRHSSYTRTHPVSPFTTSSTPLPATFAPSTSSTLQMTAPCAMREKIVPM